ncbi:hypothetical protein BSKO_08385 [Bryopsis sp. KO-2023]|nr:hypothetical protein BSKO_08385 [Bryopsis sp. KO-2023]
MQRRIGEGVDRGVDSFLQSLPAGVRQNVRRLQELQKRCDDINAEYLREKMALEEKFRKRYEPVYSERAEIISGDGQQNGNADGPGAVPGFWIKVLKSMVAVREHINKSDESVLKYLKDIRVHGLEGDQQGFKLTFYFWKNEFFAEEELTKAYIMGSEDDSLVERTEGSRITWADGKNPGLKVLRRRRQVEGEPPVTKIVEIHSFFDFFAPPKLPESGEDEDVTVDEIAELHELVEEDFEVGCLLRQMLIPKAVSLYTGEILEEHDSDLESVDEEVMEYSSSGER